MCSIKERRNSIEIEYDPEYGARGQKGTYVYKIPCEKCGIVLKKSYYREDIHYLCDYCKKSMKQKRKIVFTDQTDEVKTKKEKQFIKAVQKIKSQVKDVGEYENSIKIARTRVEKYGSIPEAMVAIELIKLGFSIIPQQKIGKYRVDFLLPKEKMVIEVDGMLFHNNSANCDREAVIQLSLGFDWKIIHIPAELISNNIKKLNEIMELKN